MSTEKQTGKISYYFLDNWSGDCHEYGTLREAKKEAKKYTYGFSVVIHKGGAIAALVEPHENPLP